MSVSGSANDVSTVVMKTADVPAASFDSVQVDAQEDRRIHGFEVDFTSIEVGFDIGATAELFVGVNPNVGGDTADDIGGKLYAEADIDIDSSTGAVYFTGDRLSLASDVSFDWNEDVTLTLKCENGGSETGVVAKARVYYSEV